MSFLLVAQTKQLMRFKLFVFFIFLTNLSFAQNSVLSAGTWIKVGIKENAVYKLDAAFFKKSGIDTKKINPQNIQIFTGQIGVLPQKNDDNRTKDLVEIPVFCQDKDQIFDKNDFVLFYGTTPHKIYLDSVKNTFAHKLNPYSDSSFYFINIEGKPSKRIINQPIVQNSEVAISSLNYFEFHEIESKNILNSGRTWLGEFFYNSLSLNFNIQNLDITQPLLLKSRVLGIGRSTQKLTFGFNKTPVSKIELFANEYNSNDNFARYNRVSNFEDIDIALKSEKESGEFSYALATENSANAGAYLDFYEINCKKKFVFNPQNQEIFWFVKPNGKSVFKFQISNANANTLIWQISSNNNLSSIIANSAGEFNLKLEENYAQFITFSFSNTINPNFVKKIKNQNLINVETPELLIVYAEKFKNDADRLVIHKKTNIDINALAVTTDQIYNEFSGGKVDPSAIRDFCKFLFNKDKAKFKSLLLMGDGSFDYKNNNQITYASPFNMVPTYQSNESLEPIYSFSSDDYYGFLENHEGQWAEGYSQNNYWISNKENDHTLDIAVGRLPVKTIFEAKNIVDKIIRYETNKSEADNWKQKLTFVADNRDYNIHQNDAENLSTIALTSYPGFEVNKIYLDQYPITGTKQIPTAFDATKTLNNAVNDGGFLINYNGHGSEDGWAQEKLLTNTDISQWINVNKLPIFFTATCQFGKFDNPAIVSGAELSLLNPNGGAIALLTTTRPVYSSTNEKINTAFYANFIKAKTIGELFLLTKNASIEGEINRNFSLLGDPSLRLPNFDNDLEIQTINDKSPNNQIFKSLETIEIKGTSKIINNGKIKINVYDKSTSQKTLGGFIDSPVFEYQKQNNKLLEGIFEVVNNTFTAKFILPKDVSDQEGFGKISLFAVNQDSSLQSFGYLNKLLFTVQNNLEGSDKTPPTINFEIKDNFNLAITAKDVSGLNVALNTDRKMTLIVNDTLIIDLTKYFKFTSGNNVGIINYFFGSLPNGNYQAKCIVYDIYNNKAEQTFEFNIERPIFVVNRSFNYPNPIVNYTSIVVNHNRKGDNIEANLFIFNGLGKTLFETNKKCNNCDNTIEFGLEFDEKLSYGTQLFYKVNLISTNENLKTEAKGKLMFWK
jgi:hypothetical protein